MINDVQKLCQQFLCGTPVTENLFKDIGWTLQNQALILTKTLNNPLVKKYPLKIEYQKVFLKTLLNYIEKQGLEVDEDLYVTYSQLVSSTGTSVCYKHYCCQKPGLVISLVEDVHLISEGTTGLRTWQASLALAEWCLFNKHLLTGKSMLELGSGVGLTGLVTILECQPKQYYFTDCHHSVLNILSRNIALNCQDLSVENIATVPNLQQLQTYNLISGSSISVLNLPWEEIDDPACDALGTVDTILAADVVYDSELFPSLVRGLKLIWSRCGVKQIVFACTERNSETLATFLHQIGQIFQIVEEDCPSPSTFTWPTEPPVRIFKFTQQ